MIGNETRAFWEDDGYISYKVSWETEETLRERERERGRVFSLLEVLDVNIMYFITCMEEAMDM